MSSIFVVSRCGFFGYQKKISFFRKLKFEVSQNLNFPTSLGTVRVLSGVAKLASKCDCSITLSFRDVTFLSFI